MSLLSKKQASSRAILKRTLLVLLLVFWSLNGYSSTLPTSSTITQTMVESTNGINGTSGTNGVIGVGGYPSNGGITPSSNGGIGYGVTRPPYFYGIINPMELVENASASNQWTWYPATLTSSYPPTFSPLSPNQDTQYSATVPTGVINPNIIDYSTMTTTTTGCFWTTNTSSLYNGPTLTPNCVVIPISGVYRFTLSFDYTNNSTTAICGLGPLVSSYWGNTIMASMPVSADNFGNNGLIIMGTTTLLQGAVYGQTMTNTAFVTQGQVIEVYFQFSNFSHGNTLCDITITGGSLEIQLVSY